MPEASVKLDEMPDALSVKQVQQVLGVGRDVVVRLHEQGRLRYLRLGHRRITPKSSVRELLEGKSGEG